MLKGLVAGIVNLSLALAGGAEIPATTVVLSAGVVGFFGYGVSLVLFVLGLRHLGAARTGVYFSLAPFLGAVLAVVILGDTISVTLLAAAGLMGVGLWLHLAERHEHEHFHTLLEHEHRHRHDEHHEHDHAPGIDQREPHTHPHRHSHYPDLHHRHGHQHALKMKLG
ncbi:DMT family transporter [Lichenicola cladoniae]|nr:DMT family transporter [Lichenicola cladoniae]